MAGTTASILLVEDDDLVARAVARALRRAGFAVTSAASLKAAHAATGPFRCAVLDLDLPDGSGDDLASRLLAGGIVPCVVFFTGSANVHVLQAAARLGPVVGKSEGTGRLIEVLIEVLAETLESGVAPVDSENGAPAVDLPDELRGSGRGSRRTQ